MAKVSYRTTVGVASDSQDPSVCRCSKVYCWLNLKSQCPYLSVDRPIIKGETGETQLTGPLSLTTLSPWTLKSHLFH